MWHRPVGDQEEMHIPRWQNLQQQRCVIHMLVGAWVYIRILYGARQSLFSNVNTFNFGAIPMASLLESLFHFWMHAVCSGLVKFSRCLKFNLLCATIHVTSHKSKTEYSGVLLKSVNRGKQHQRCVSVQTCFLLIWGGAEYPTCLGNSSEMLVSFFSWFKKKLKHFRGPLKVLWAVSTVPNG